MCVVRTELVLLRVTQFLEHSISIFLRFPFVQPSLTYHQLPCMLIIAFTLKKHCDQKLMPVIHTLLFASYRNPTRADLVKIGMWIIELATPRNVEPGQRPGRLPLRGTAGCQQAAAAPRLPLQIALLLLSACSSSPSTRPHSVLRAGPCTPGPWVRPQDGCGNRLRSNLNMCF